MDHHHHHHHHGKEPLIKINVSHGPSQHEIFVSPNSTFGYLKKLIDEKAGVEPDRQKILFRGKEKEDDGEYLREAGVKDNSKILVLEEKKEKQVEEMMEDSEGTSTVKVSEEGISSEMEAKDGGEKMSKAFRAIAETRVEVDKLAERVAALQVAVNGGTKVSEDEFVASSELLMRQLLKLDEIEAEGEAKLQRRAEVQRVQNFHEILDNLKARNSNPFLDSDNAVSVTTAWETFDSGVGSLSPPPGKPSTTRITEDWERFD